MSGKEATFPWHNDVAVRNLGVAPLVLAARALTLMEYHEATAVEHGAEPLRLTRGVSGAARVLAETGELEPLGAIMAGLEALVPPDYRRDWPGADALERGGILQEARRVVDETPPSA